MVDSVTRKRGILEISSSGFVRQGDRDQGAYHLRSRCQAAPKNQPSAASNVEGERFHVTYVELSAKQDSLNREALVVVIKTRNGKSCRIEMQDVHAEAMPITPTEDFVKMLVDL